MYRKSIASTACAVAALLCAPANAETGREDRVQEFFEEIPVTAVPTGQTTYELFQGASLLRGEALTRSLSTTLGESLDQLPGISQSYFGAGSSRPLIRGLGGDRIRVLVGGIGTLDVSTTSVDHQSAIDLQTAESVEVIRGPATLLYGSNAAGGIINVVDGRIPKAAPENGYSVSGGAGFGTAANETTVNAQVTAALAPSIVVNLSGSFTESDDYTIPGFLESAALRAAEEAEAGGEEEGEEEVFGTVPNSATQNAFVSGGISTVGDWGFLGVSVSYYDSDYGIPAAHGHEEGEEGEGADEEGEEEEEVVTIGLEQIRVDLMGAYNIDGAFLKTANIRFGWADYEQTEFEGTEVGTVFDNREWEGRLELIQANRNGHSGAFGVQLRNRDFSAIGAEAFVPPNTLKQYGIFTTQRLETGPYSLEAGARYDRQDNTSEFRPSEDGPLPGADRDFNLFSFSLGASYDLNDAMRASASFFRTQRAPSAEELFSGGPHLATQVFEIGDVTLGKETALGGEISLRRDGDIVDGEIAAFYTSYDNFIFERFTGETEDGLPVAAFTGTDATFYGIEAFTKVHFYRSGDTHAHIELGADFVRGDNDGSDTALPRIPPYTLRSAIDYHGSMIDARLDLAYSGMKDRTAEFETVTDDFFRMDATIDFHPFEDKDISFVAQVRNLTNEEIRFHTSFLKDVLPAPGRDVRFSVRASF